MQFFSLIAAILFVLGTGFFIPIFMKYLNMGVVTKIPSLIVICFVILSAIICLFSGIILSTLVQQHKQNFEFQLQEVKDHRTLLLQKKKECSKEGQPEKHSVRNSRS